MVSIVFQPAMITAAIPEAVSYLQNQTPDAWITMALAVFGSSNIPTGHLSSVSGTLATDYAKAILALASVNENPATFGNIDYVAKLKTYYDGSQIGSNSLLNDDIWSILALASVNQVDSVEALAAKNFILANQNVDGGWSYAVGGQSDSNDTASAIIALIEAGLSSSDQVITKALSYLESCQNEDGGFGYQTGDVSDSGSTSWVISALTKSQISPESWSRQEGDPISFLQSLQASDGGFWWVEEGTSDWNNKAMTAFAVIALSGKSYPVGYFQFPEENQQPGTYHLRIEGSSNTICSSYVFGNTALDIIENGAQVCGYTYTITQESYGPYLRTINGDSAEGMSGWLYFVNNVSLPVGASDYQLQPGDEVLWYFGEWGINPTRIRADSVQIDPGQNVEIIVEYFDGSTWQNLAFADIKINNKYYSADSSGKLELTMAESGVYQAYVEMQGYVRSDKLTISVGDAVNYNVGLTVEIEQGGVVGGEAIALVVNPSSINFGKLTPGQSSNRAATLTNEGTVNISVSASISGDTIFTENLLVDGSNPDLYNQFLTPNQSKDSTVTLNIPSNYFLSGVKSGELIFWAVAL